MMDGYGDEDGVFKYDSDVDSDDLQELEIALYSQIHYDTTEEAEPSEYQISSDVFTDQSSQSIITMVPKQGSNLKKSAFVVKQNVQVIADKFVGPQSKEILSKLTKGLHRLEVKNFKTGNIKKVAASKSTVDISSEDSGSIIVQDSETYEFQPIEDTTTSSKNLPLSQKERKRKLKQKSKTRETLISAKWYESAEIEIAGSNVVEIIDSSTSDSVELVSDPPKVQLKDKNKSKSTKIKHNLNVSGTTHKANVSVKTKTKLKKADKSKTNSEVTPIIFGHDTAVISDRSQFSTFGSPLQKTTALTKHTKKIKLEKSKKFPKAIGGKVLSESSDVVLLDDFSSQSSAETFVKKSKEKNKANSKLKKLKTTFDKSVKNIKTKVNKVFTSTSTPKTKHALSVITESAALEIIDSPSKITKLHKKRKTKEKVVTVESDSDDGTDDSIYDTMRISHSESDVETLSDLDSNSCPVDIALNVREKPLFEGVKDESSALKAVLDSLGECDWSMIGQDQGYGLMRNRYYAPIKVKCRNCNEKGHLSKCCPKPQKIPSCLWCGRSGHFKNRCDRVHCRNCNAVHTGVECPFPRRNKHRECPTCLIQGHTANECSNVWRQFHATTSANNLKERGEMRNESAHCSNCAKRGHFEYDCRDERMDFWSTPIYPFIPKYNLRHQYNEITRTSGAKSRTPNTNVRAPNASYLKHLKRKSDQSVRHSALVEEPLPKKRRVKPKEKKKKKITDWPERHPDSIIYDSEDDVKVKKGKFKKAKQRRSCIEQDFPRGGNESYGNAERHGNTYRSREKSNNWPFRSASKKSNSDDYNEHTRIRPRRKRKSKSKRNSIE